MFENILNFFKKFGKNEIKETSGSKNKAKERLHLVLMQDRANVSADFLEMMKQEIIEVIKKYIEVEEKEIDVRLTNEVKEDGTTGAPSLYANIPILNIRNDMKKEVEEHKEEITKNEKNFEKVDTDEKTVEQGNKKEVIQKNKNEKIEQENNEKKQDIKASEKEKNEEDKSNLQGDKKKKVETARTMEKLKKVKNKIKEAENV